MNNYVNQFSIINLQLYSQSVKSFSIQYFIEFLSFHLSFNLIQTYIKISFIHSLRKNQKIYGGKIMINKNYLNRCREGVRQLNEKQRKKQKYKHIFISQSATYKFQRF